MHRHMATANAAGGASSSGGGGALPGVSSLSHDARQQLFRAALRADGSAGPGRGFSASLPPAGQSAPAEPHAPALSNRQRVEAQRVRMAQLAGARTLAGERKQATKARHARVPH